MFGYSLRILAVVAFSAAAIGPASSMSLGLKAGLSNIWDQSDLVRRKVDTAGDGKKDTKLPKVPKEPEPPKER
jgi:hypothetical protein